MPAPKRNVAGNIIKAVAKKVAKKPVVKLQPKPNLKANPKSNVKVVSSGKSPQQLSAERQYLREKNNAAVYTGKGKVQVPTSNWEKEILREAAKIAKMRKRDTTQLQMIKYK